ncbi:MAG: hemolysin family protein [Ignavibacteriaceae bacterium]
MLSDIILLLGLLILSGFFSGSELAFVVSNKVKIEVKARKKNLAGRFAEFFIRNPQDFFSTILIGNNIVNIALASVATIFLTNAFGWGDGTILAVSTVVLLIFGELLPKYLASETADRAVMIISVPLRIISIILYPVVKLTARIASLFLKIFGGSDDPVVVLEKQDVHLIVEESRKAGRMDKKESDIISKALSLGEQRVHESMRPRTEIVGVEINQSIDETISVFIESGYSKLPVYEENLDNIKGVVLAYDLFRNPSNLQEIMREIIFVPETKGSFGMLNEFLDKGVSIAVVVDEFGGTAGIVTMEDIIEELFGEIEDEYDVAEDICRRINPNTFLISGKVEIDFINDKYNIGLPEGNYETIGGFITSATGRIPKQGEVIDIGNFSILIVRADQIKIELVRLTVKEK